MKKILLAFLLAATAWAEPKLSETGHEAWDSLLKEFVDTEHRVDYAELKAKAFDRLTGYTSRLTAAEKPDPRSPEGKALLINAYNALVVQWVIENYPTRSIMATSNPFEARRHEVAGEKVSLDEIENKLRETGDPRIHSVLVCAALSCPPLRREAYVADRIEQQLNDNTRQWLANESLNQIDPESGEAELSPIFSWYREDFEAYPGGLEGFVHNYAPAGKIEALGDRDLEFSFKKYNWGLNDQSGIGDDYSRLNLTWDWLKNLFR